MLMCGYYFFVEGCAVVTIKGLKKNITREQINTILMVSSKKILKEAKVNYQIIWAENFEYIDGAPRIYMSNHLSLFDTVMLYAAIPDTIRIVTKKELTRIPIIGHAIRISENPIVKRDQPGNNQDFYADAKDKLKSGIAIWVYPEGTRSTTGHLLPFKPGGFRLAIEAGAQIIPVGIKNTNRILPKKKLMPELYQSAQISIGQPILYKSNSHPDQFKNLMETVYNQINKLSQAEDGLCLKEKSRN